VLANHNATLITPVPVTNLDRRGSTAACSASQSGPQSWFERCRGVGDDVEAVLVIGHNPGLERLTTPQSGVLMSCPTPPSAVSAR
jgi:phosphohistidine phosphatase SixA